MKLGWLATTPQPSRRPELGWPWRKFHFCNAFSTKPCASNTFSKSQQSTKTEYRWSNLIGLLWCLQMTTMAFKKLAKNDSINQQHMDRRYSYPATPTYLSRVKPDLGLERCSIAELKVQRRYFHGQPHVKEKSEREILRYATRVSK